MPASGRRVQRNTLTYAQMEGMGIWGKIKSFFKKPSNILKAVGLASKFIPIPGARIASLPIGLAGTALGFAGHGMHGGAMSGKGITKSQINAIRMGLAHYLPSGGVSLAMAKRLYPKIKNILPSQIRSLAAGLGRMLRSGGVSLKGGAHSGLYNSGSLKAMKCPMYARGYAGRGYSGGGVRLAGQGGFLAGSGRRYTQKKRRVRRRPMPMGVYRY